MLTRAELRKIARARFADAKALFQSGRYDGAVYLCGYAVELALKARICRTLKWSGFPESRKEFEGLQSFRVHDLEILLHLSGIAPRVRTQHMVSWSVVAKWDPESRHNRVGTANRSDAQLMINETKPLLEIL